MGRSFTTKRLLWEKQQGRCFYCKQPTRLMKIPECGRQPEDMATYDHFLPRSKNKGLGNGTHINDNLVIACRKCNREKDNMEPDVFLRKIRQEAS